MDGWMDGWMDVLMGWVGVYWWGEEGGRENDSEWREIKRERGGEREGERSIYTLRGRHNCSFVYCRNTASMLGETWLGKHFDVIGDRSVHYGAFDCGGPPVAMPGGDGSGACASGACC